MRALADEEQTIIQTGRLSARQLVAAAVFLVFALWLSTVVPSIQIAWVTCFLVLTIYLFAFEVVSVDVAAVSIMVLLGLTSLLAPVMGLEQGLVAHTHDNGRDASRVVPHTLQFEYDVHRRHDETQITGGRLLAGDQAHTVPFNLEAQRVGVLVLGDDLLGQ